MKQNPILRALILANGTPPSRALLLHCLAESHLFICADGGANAAARFRIAPDLIIGDLDSIRPHTLRTFSHSAIRHIREQETTDLEKALRWCVEHCIDAVTILGASGGRLDHAVVNLGTLAKFAARMNIRMVDDHGTIVPIGRGGRFILRPGTVVSLLPLTRCTGVTTRGLQWNLVDATLSLGERESMSNVVASQRISIRLRRGILLFFVAASR